MNFTEADQTGEMEINFDASLLPNLTDILSPDIEDLIFVELARELIKSVDLERSVKLIGEAFRLHQHNYLNSTRYSMLHKLYEQQELMIQLQKIANRNPLA